MTLLNTEMLTTLVAVAGGWILARLGVIIETRSGIKTAYSKGVADILVMIRELEIIHFIDTDLTTSPPPESRFVELRSQLISRNVTRPHEFDSRCAQTVTTLAGVDPVIAVHIESQIREYTSYRDKLSAWTSADVAEYLQWWKINVRVNDLIRENFRGIAKTLAWRHSILMWFRISVHLRKSEKDHNKSYAWLKERYKAGS